MRNIYKPSLLFIAGMISTVILIFIFGFEDNKNIVKAGHGTNMQKWTIPAIPEKFDFAGEKVPMEQPEVREYFDRNFTRI